MSLSHAQKRAKERYDLVLSTQDIADISAQIRARKDAMMMRGSHEGREVWAVKVQGVWAQVVYLPITRGIATFLPPTARARRTG